MAKYLNTMYSRLKRTLHETYDFKLEAIGFLTEKPIPTGASPKKIVFFKSWLARSMAVCVAPFSPARRKSDKLTIEHEAPGEPVDPLVLLGALIVGIETPTREARPHALEHRIERSTAPYTLKTKCTSYCRNSSAVFISAN